MTSRVFTFISFLVLLLPFVAAGHWSRHHQEVALRARGDVDVHKRDAYLNSRFTWYDVGLGACGVTNVPTDWIVALNVEQYGSGYPGPQCFKWITIQWGGKTATAQIMDECMGCPYGGLDFSKGLFTYFDDLGAGVLYGEWWFDGESGDQTTSTWAAPTTTWEPPATTSTPDYTPPTTSNTPDYTPPTTSNTPDYTPPTTSNTPDYTPPTSTSSTPTYTPPPSTTTSSTASSTSSSTSPTSSINSNTSLTSGLAVPTGGVSAPDANHPENIIVINNIMVKLGAVLYAAERNT